MARLPQSLAGRERCTRAEQCIALCVQRSELDNRSEPAGTSVHPPRSLKLTSQ